MSVIIQSRPECLNQNFKNILKYLDRQYPNYGFDEVEEDIKRGDASLERELFNVYKTLTFLKERNKSNSKKCAAINQYLKLLMKENKVN